MTANHTHTPDEYKVTVEAPHFLIVLELNDEEDFELIREVLDWTKRVLKAHNTHVEEDEP